MTNTQGRLQDSNRLHEVRSQDQLLLPVDTKTVGRELLAQNVEGTLDVLGPLVDDVKIGISLNKTTGAGANGRTHVRDEESTIRLCPNLIRNRRENSTVTLQEFGTVRVGSIEVESGVLDSPD